MARAVSRWPFVAQARVRARINLNGIVVGKVALGLVFFRVFLFSPVSIIPT
jgi:hypothetical protein